uniref:Uncharacterized protein n=1 Tax=Anguilla anguilla TaxID=7936 RepID=A0A0E9RQI9_ANGAN
MTYRDSLGIRNACHYKKKGRISLSGERSVHCN